MALALRKCETHLHFWVEDKVVFECYTDNDVIKNRAILKLNCYYPNNKKLTQQMIDYLNRYLYMFPLKEEKINEQLDLF